MSRMSSSSRKKYKHEKGSEVFEDHHNGGTAARTRPFSFDEIMLRRKNKKESGNVEDPPEKETITGKSTSVKLSAHEESNRHKHRHNDVGTSSGKRVSDESGKVISRRKEDDISIKERKQMIDEETSRRKEEDISIKEKKRMKDEEKGSHDMERKAKAALNTNNSGDKAKGGRNYRLTHDKRKDELSDDSGYDHGKRDSKVSIFKDRHAYEGRGASEIGSRRKKENEYDKRTRDQNAAKKYDSKKRHDTEFSERKEKKEAIQSHHEDSRSKRGRSRSRDHDKEKAKRSFIPAPEKKEKKEALKSHDDSKFSERKEKKEAAESLHDDSRSKIRRSRSRELDKEKAKRSFSPAPEKKEKKEASKSRHEESEFSERKEKKEAAESRHDNSRSKRRRSWSREHDKEKGRMSLSPAPEKKKKKEAPKSRHDDSKPKRGRSSSREHKKDKNRSSHSPFSKDTREHGELTSHFSKDKSGRSISDNDRTKMQLNGSSNQSRRHGTSSSRLGGYSPRKRRSEAAIKTPSPTGRSPEKKSARWDSPSVEAESNYPRSVLSKLEPSNQTVPSNKPELSGVVSVPLTSSNPKPILGVVSTIPSLIIKPSIDSIQLTQATRPKRRLYVKNLPPSASEEAVMNWINSYLLSSGGNQIQGTNPCISCIIHKEKGQALLEFLTPEDASAALSFDGRTFSGAILKIRRPKDFTEVTGVCVGYIIIHIQDGDEADSLIKKIFRYCGVSVGHDSRQARTGVPEKSMAGVDSIRDIVEDSPHKIFIGGISNRISSEMLMEIVSAFGHLKAYHFETNMDLTGSCAFLEYVDRSVTTKACAGLNGIRLGGQVLTVTQAIPEDLSVPENPGSKPFYGIPDHAKPLLAKPTQVLKLCNVLDPNSLSSLSEPELDEILEDIRLECARFGTVKSINIIKPTKCSFVEKEDHVDKEKTEKEGMDLDKENIGSSDMSSVNQVNEELEEVKKHTKESSESEVADGAQLSQLSDKLNKEPEEHNKDIIGDSDVDQETLPCASTNELITQVDDQLTGQENKPANNIIKIEDHETENEVLGQAELKTENENGDIEKELDLHDVNTEEGLDLTEKDFQKDDESDMKDVFEPGCVLVEYKRADTSSIAAHCLHGQLFDNRMVRVEYISHDLYCARFLK